MQSIRNLVETSVCYNSTFQALLHFPSNIKPTGNLRPKMSFSQTAPQFSQAAMLDEYISKHLRPASQMFNDGLQHALPNSAKYGLPPISVSPSQGKFLKIQCQLQGAKNILEIGTLGGYSAMWFAEAGEDVHVTSIEINPKHRDVALENIRYAGLSRQVD